jgi:hypothetical protein
VYNVSSITVNANALSQDGPTQLTFNVTPSQGTIARAFLSTAGYGHNFNPSVTIVAGGSININFGTNAVYNEYVTSGAIYFLTIRWA